MELDRGRARCKSYLYVCFLASKQGIINTIFLFISGKFVTGIVIDSQGLVQMPIRTVYW
ncbi:DMT family transporter [Acinetobacter sp. ULE_I001]|uniref:DMT family transporter n=1 Tax=unclassified Acinetobacter TaxID=196816 RepID=UPI003AF815A3